MAPAGREKTLHLLAPRPLTLLLGWELEWQSTWMCANKEVLLFACSFTGWQLRKSLPLILSFEGIKQVALMGGNAALKILPFVSKAFLLLLLGQVQSEMESAFQALSQMFLLATSRTKEWKWDQGSNRQGLVHKWALPGWELLLDVFLPENCFKYTAFYKGQKSAASVLSVLIMTSWSF